MTQPHPGDLPTESEPLFTPYRYRRHGAKRTQQGPQAFSLAIIRSSQRTLYPAAHSTACSLSPSAPFSCQRGLHSARLAATDLGRLQRLEEFVCGNGLAHRLGQQRIELFGGVHAAQLHQLIARSVDIQRRRPPSTVLTA